MRRVVTPKWKLSSSYKTWPESEAGTWSVTAFNQSKMPAMFEPLELTLRSSDSRVDIVDFTSSNPGLINPGDLAVFNLNLTFEGIEEEAQSASSKKADFFNDRDALFEASKKRILSDFFDPTVWQAEGKTLFFTVEFMSGKEAEKVTLDLTKPRLFTRERALGILRKSSPSSMLEW